MTIPGFTAEASLRGMRGYDRLEIRARASRANLVQPAGCTACEQDPETGEWSRWCCTKYGCDNIACRPPGGGGGGTGGGGSTDPCAGKGPSSMQDCTSFGLGSTEGCPPCEACLDKERFNCETAWDCWFGPDNPPQWWNRWACTPTESCSVRYVCLNNPR